MKAQKFYVKLSEVIELLSFAVRMKIQIAFEDVGHTVLCTIFIYNSKIFLDVYSLLFLSQDRPDYTVVVNTLWMHWSKTANTFFVPNNARERDSFNHCHLESQLEEQPPFNTFLN